MAELGEGAPGRFYGVGILNYWDPAGTRASIEDMKALNLKTCVAPILPGKNRDGKSIDYTSDAMEPLWLAIEESGMPLCVHIGGNPAAESNTRGVFATSFMMTFISLRRTWSRLVFGGVFDRHPGLKVAFCDNGINWVATMLQDAEFVYGCMAR